MIEPEAAKAWQTLHALASKPASGAEPGDVVAPSLHPPEPGGGLFDRRGSVTSPSPAKATTFHGSATVNAATARMSMVTLADEIIAALASDPHAEVKVTVEIRASLLQGAPVHVKRAVTENSAALGFKVREWG